MLEMPKSIDYLGHMNSMDTCILTGKKEDTLHYYYTFKYGKTKTEKVVLSHEGRDIINKMKGAYTTYKHLEDDK